MARKRKPPRLYLSPKERTWVIRDGAHTERTGCSEADSARAEEALGRYLATKFTPVVRERDPDRISVAEVLTAYGREHAPSRRDPARIGYAIMPLTEVWGTRMLSAVRGSSCREYAEERRDVGIADGTIRRELGVLSAAIRHWHKEHGPLASVPVVTMPPAPEPNPHWLTRREAALLLAGALGWYRERWCDLSSRAERFRWRRAPTRMQRHAARFILLGLYTGTRSGDIVNLGWMPNTAGGWVDLERGVVHRRGIGQAETNKRKPPARLGLRILAHLRRWARLTNGAYVVSYDGEPVDKIRRAWASAVELAGLGPEVTPHILRHTRATWMMQAGVEIWEAAGHLGMSPEILRRVYGHHHPDFQQRAAEV